MFPIPFPRRKLMREVEISLLKLLLRSLKRCLSASTSSYWCRRIASCPSFLVFCRCSQSRFLGGNWRRKLKFPSSKGAIAFGVVGDMNPNPNQQVEISLLKLLLRLLKCCLSASTSLKSSIVATNGIPINVCPVPVGSNTLSGQKP